MTGRLLFPVRAMKSEPQAAAKCADLVDCSAEWPNNVINNSNALDIASRLASHYNIGVSTDVDDLVKVRNFP